MLSREAAHEEGERDAYEEADQGEYAVGKVRDRKGVEAKNEGEGEEQYEDSKAEQGVSIVHCALLLVLSVYWASKAADSIILLSEKRKRSGKKTEHV